MGGLLFVAALWASEPGGADPPASSWNPGSTVTTWDWERHWNYWMRWVCSEKGYLPGVPVLKCIRWSQDGPEWKPCGSEIRPPDPDRINSCGIGQAGGHEPHGDDVNEKYTYLGKHEDRTGPTYPVCEGDPDLPADTGPNNCGTWVTTPHDHCPGDDDAHPPDCPTSTPEPTTSESSSSTTSPPVITRPPTTAGPPTTVSDDPWACFEPETYEALDDAMDDQRAPGLGLRPGAHGYVGVPMESSYTADNRDSFTVRVGSERVYVRMWVSWVSWIFTDLGTLDGVELGRRAFHRHAPRYRDARSLRRTVAVTIGGEDVVYRRSSFRSGYPEGYPVTLRVTWTAECRQRGVAGWTEIDEADRIYRHDYKVYAIRSRPD
ncbi:MAG: hypothetical protein OXS29_09750 [bacterium]|nr:hypothetical protein [bacterium]MDE0287417.1 hypothetical protein [bacterium]MDE0438836.1 hypothetical protein [bacterium]